MLVRRATGWVFGKATDDDSLGGSATHGVPGYGSQEL
jgi:hypothetical protein